jgi:hypothetical protein
MGAKTKGKTQIILSLSAMAKKKPEAEECHNCLTEGFSQQENSLTFGSEGVKSRHAADKETKKRP